MIKNARVKPVTSLGRSGLSDWLVQRITAVVLLAYTLFIVIALFAIDMDYTRWKALFAHTWVRAFSIAALLSIAAHAWIGLWAVSTDYLTERLLGAKATFLRLGFQALCAILLFVYIVWGIQILWG